MNWVAIKAFHRLFLNGKIKQLDSVSKDPYFQSFLQSGEVIEVGKHYYSTDAFKEIYAKKHLAKFKEYVGFLARLNLENKRFEDSEIEFLIDLEKKVIDNSLVPSKEQIAEAQETVRGISTMFFRNDKYLDKKSSLIEAIEGILSVKLVDNKDQQYLYVLQCENPILIVLCENLDFLRKDKMPRKKRYELWYAGGRNVPKLQFADTRGLPLYYCCDWDQDGLEIFELAKKTIPELQLLFPNGLSESIIDSEHKSQWKNRENPELISGLNGSLYPSRYKKRIEKLIAENHWIIEESNDLEKMVKNFEH